MNKKIVVSLIALAVFIGGIAFVVTRNNDGGADEAVASVQELPELETQEIDKVETAEAVAEVEEEPEVIEEEAEADEEETIVAEAEGVSEDEEDEEVEQETESIVAVENTEVKDAELEQKKEEVIAEVKKDVPDANIVDSSSSSKSQSELQQEALARFAAAGMTNTAGTYGYSNAGTNDMSNAINDVGMWE